MIASNDYTRHALELTNEVSKKTQYKILEQLNDLIERGILVLKTGPGALVRSENTNTIEYRQLIELELYNEEYVKDLEEKVGTYKEINEIKTEKIQELEDDIVNYRRAILDLGGTISNDLD